MTEQEQRNAVLEEARSWVGTPYHHMGRVKGAGVDCALLILETFTRAGIVDRFDVGSYNHDWHLHRSEERYLEVVEAHMHRIDSDDLCLDEKAIPDSIDTGDVILFQMGRTFSHGGIVAKWPYFIHSYFPSRIVEEVSILNTPMSARKARIFSYWGHDR